MAADFNGDETVDDLDLDRWQYGFGATSGATAAYGDTDGDIDVDGADFLQWQREVGPKQPNVIVYRPQGLHDLTNPTDAPVYDTFRKSPVKEVDETSNTLGPGIRINLDDDNTNEIPDANESGIEIPRENDLIEVKIERMPGQGDLVLSVGSQLSLYYSHDKEIPVPLIGGESEPLPFVNDTATVFVEWTSGTHGFANMSLVDTTTMNVVDSVRFHSFKSLVIVFGGNGQDPHDTDGDGNIGDPVDGPNGEGIFYMAQFLYDNGWDVLPFDEEAVDDPEDIPYTEALSAAQSRRVEVPLGGGVSIMGYSQGGGATHDLIERLSSDGIVPRFGVYLDAVRHDFAAPQTEWPEAVLYLLSFYQTNSTLRGGDIDDTEVFPGTTLEEYDLTAQPDPVLAALTHFTIDDDLTVLNTIITRLNQLQDR